MGAKTENGQLAAKILDVFKAGKVDVLSVLKYPPLVMFVKFHLSINFYF